jgi:hypothetical protein
MAPLADLENYLLERIADRRLPGLAPLAVSNRPTKVPPIQIRSATVQHSQRGADQKEIWDSRLPNNLDHTFLADKLRYLLKSPQKVYRIYKTER